MLLCRRGDGNRCKPQNNEENILEVISIKWSVMELTPRDVNLEKHWKCFFWFDLEEYTRNASK